MALSCFNIRGGRVVRWCWVNFQCRGVLHLDYSRARAYCACSTCGWGGLDIFTLISPLSLSPSVWETAQLRLKYCLKGLLNPKQPTNQPMFHYCVPIKFDLFFIYIKPPSDDVQRARTIIPPTEKAPLKFLV